MTDTLRAALERDKEHSLCGQPTFTGCFAHFSGPHCRADGLPWPCDVESIRAALAALAAAPITDPDSLHVEGISDEEWDRLHKAIAEPAAPAPALDVERLARAESAVGMPLLDKAKGAYWSRRAALVAAEYERLGAGES